jgi:hypothetical protein
MSVIKHILSIYEKAIYEFRDSIGMLYVQVWGNPSDQK